MSSAARGAPRYSLPYRLLKQGKVRDVYEVGENLLLVATDRISAFDWVLPTEIPDKGRVLNLLSEFWFKRFRRESNSPIPEDHLITTDVREMGLAGGFDHRPLEGRAMLVRRTAVVPIECVVRGYLSGSGWKEYQQHGTVCGEVIWSNLKESAKLPYPIFTPATKADTGHDENIPIHEMESRITRLLTWELLRRSLALYEAAAAHALTRGIIIADTKFEWGLTEAKEPILIDEVLTPDSSRFWPQQDYHPGGPQPSFDKQYVRDWLERSGWDKNSPPPELPPDVVAKTREKYIEAYEILTGEAFAWK